ncbi:hypothetical protein [Nonomuraea sp. NPDC049400]|uniref:hypothetical protein n=1 Tax=Nonomuraea sp. NPDC049400 TaxID=3364352 RepID=UPI003795E4AD
MASWLPGTEGDGVADPLFGAGLRTDRARDRLKAARDRLASGDGYAKAAAAVLMLSGHGWNADGPVRDTRAVLAALGTAAALLERSKTDTYAVDDAVVPVARDIARSAGRRPDLQAAADHELAAGNVRKAVDLPARAAR